MLTDFGIRSMIIISDEFNKIKFLQTCWTIQFIRGVCVYGIILIIAIIIWAIQEFGVTGTESVYSAPEISPAIAISGFALVLQGLESVNQHVYAREMKFGPATQIQITFSVVGPIITISLALFWPSVWVLVISGLMITSLRLFMTYWMFPGLPMGFCLQRDYAREIFDRGKWIMSHSILSVATNTADKILLSVFLPASTFGIYSLAFQMIEIPRQFLDKVQHSLLLQVFQSLEKSGDFAQMKQQYYRYRIPYDVLACMATGGFLTASPALIDLMYDPRYAQAGEIMQVLALGLPLMGIGVIREAFISQRRFRLMSLVGLIQAGTIWLGLLVALPVMGSMLGAFLVIAFHRVPELMTLLGLARRENWIVPWKEVRLWPVILIGAALGWGVDYLWSLVAP